MRSRILALLRRQVLWTELYVNRLLADTDAAVLAAVEHDLLRVEVLETALFKALAALQDQAGPEAAGQALRDELTRLDSEVAKLAAAIAAGGSLESLFGLLQEREGRRAHVRAALAEQERQRARRDGADDPLALMLEVLGEWQATLKAETGPARTALQALLAGRLVFTPTEQGYTFAGPGTVSPVIAGIVQKALAKGSGARTRTIPPAMWRALQHRDRGCRFPGCAGRPAQVAWGSAWMSAGRSTSCIHLPAGRRSAAPGRRVYGKLVSARSSQRVLWRVVHEATYGRAPPRPSGMAVAASLPRRLLRHDAGDPLPRRQNAAAPVCRRLLRAG